MLSRHNCCVRQLLVSCNSVNRCYTSLQLATSRVSNCSQQTRDSYNSNRNFVRHESVISFKDVCYEYAANKPILVDASFSVERGSKVTIMGQNGSGKSTIMKLIQGKLKPSKGTVNCNTKSAIALARQVMPLDYRDITLLDYFTKELHGLTSGIDSRISATMQQVQLLAAHDRLIKSFSGGQQARLLLAGALILEPDILLLDEPTNNLDVNGIENLKEIILSTDKTCVVISHDEEFLNSFSDSVLYLDIHSKKVEQYVGNYNNVKQEITKRIHKENMENSRLIREAQKKKEKASTFANKGGNVRKAAKKLREDADELLEQKVNVRKEDSAIKDFIIPYSTEEMMGSGGWLVNIRKVVIAGGKQRVTPLKAGELKIEKKYHVHLVGPNGIGKTTFLEAIVNGTADGVDVNSSAVVGYYRQDFSNLDHESTVIDLLTKASSGKHNMQHIRKVAADLLLKGEIVKQQVKTLSEGQKGLLAFALLVLKEPSVLILDEPTNHINFRHLPVITKALNAYQGAMIVVSHDHDFVRKLNIDYTIDLAFEAE